MNYSQSSLVLFFFSLIINCSFMYLVFDALRSCVEFTLKHESTYREWFAIVFCCLMLAYGSIHLISDVVFTLSRF